MIDKALSLMYFESIEYKKEAEICASINYQRTE
jgi:hypothetical protein